MSSIGHPQRGREFPEKETLALCVLLHCIFKSNASSSWVRPSLQSPNVIWWWEAVGVDPNAQGKSICVSSVNSVVAKVVRTIINASVRLLFTSCNHFLPAWHNTTHNLQCDAALPDRRRLVLSKNSDGIFTCRAVYTHISLSLFYFSSSFPSFLKSITRVQYIITCLFTFFLCSKQSSLTNCSRSLFFCCSLFLLFTCTALTVKYITRRFINEYDPDLGEYNAVHVKDARDADCFYWSLKLIKCLITK